MTVADSLYSTGDSSKKEKDTKAPVQKSEEPEHKDATGQSSDSHSASDDHSTICAAKLDEVNKDTWFGWSSFKDMKDSVSSLFGQTPEKEKAYKTVDDIGCLNVSNIWDTTATASTDATKPVVKPDEKPVDEKSGVSGWFSKMTDAVASVGKEVTGHVTSAMDWLFSTTDTTTGQKTEVSAKNGEAHINGKNGDGVPVDVTVGQDRVHGRVGAADIALDKNTHAGTYESGAYKVTVEGTTKKVVDTATNQVFQWDEKAQKGFIADKDGKHLYDFNSKDQLTQQLTAERAITQTQTRADATADQVKRQMEAGETAPQTRLIVDKDGDYAVVRQDGVMVKTYKNGDANDPAHVPYVTIERDGHVIKIQNNMAYYQQEDPTTHAKSWVRMHGGRHRLPQGVAVDESTGAVKVDGQTVVTAAGNVQADAATHIDTKTGKMTTSSDTGAVTVENSNGRTRVRHPGCGDIVNDGKTFENEDPATQHTFRRMDSTTGKIEVFGGPNGSGITLDTKPGGNITIKEADGQTTQMSNTGYFNSVDARGNTLMNMDTAGNVTFYDGTRVGADGTVSNQYGSAKAWDGGASGTAAIAKASTAVGVAQAAIANYDISGSSLGALDAADTELASLLGAYAGMPNMNSMVAAISQMQGTVAAARDRVLQLVSVSAESRRLTGDGSASRVHEALTQNSGSVEAYLRKQQDEKLHPGDKSAVA
ncbi:MAG: hypothetical protein JST89_08100 [Cyanobacteria bacterium SZAS-4]|nr:hypothetical protein [Cyanobacteria bacterium SZAS-4]